jgi:hypothetical protein
MTLEKIEQAREEFISDLEKNIWRKECNAAFDETRLSLVQAERQKAIDEATELYKEKEAIDPKDHTRETREKKKAIDKDLAKVNKIADDCEDTMAQIVTGVKNARAEAKAYRDRADFAKTYDINVVKVEEKKPEVK